MYEDDLWERAAAKMLVAVSMLDKADHCREAWHAAGTALEFALKARIMRKEGLNRWPDRNDRKELYTHDLRKLYGIAGIDIQHVPDYMRVAVRVTLDWTRGHDYAPGTMDLEVARDMVEAVCGEEGVITWLRTCF